MSKKDNKQSKIDMLVEEKLKEERQKFVNDHTFVVETKHGNTYISVNKYDYISEVLIDKIGKLFDLMNIDYAISLIVFGKEFFFSIEGDNQDRVAFIQKFIDNGYKLSWQ